jgi:hypothetical protein
MDRPSEDDCQGKHISDKLWSLVEDCWDKHPSKRPLAPKVRDILFEMARRGIYIQLTCTKLSQSLIPRSTQRPEF